MTPFILFFGAIAALAIIVFLLTVPSRRKKHYQSSRYTDSKPQREQRPRPIPIRPVYFIRAGDQSLLDELTRRNIAFKDCNLESVRLLVYPPPPPPPPEPEPEPEPQPEPGPASEAEGSGDTPNDTPSILPGDAPAEHSSQLLPTVAVTDTPAIVAPTASAEVVVPAPEPTPEPPAPLVDPAQDGILIDAEALKMLLHYTQRGTAATLDTGLEWEHCHYYELVLYDLYPKDQASPFKITSAKRLSDPERVRIVTHNLLSSPLMAPVEIAFTSGPFADDGTFRVIVGAASAPGPWVDAPAQIWGLTISENCRQACAPGDLGHIVRAPDGYALAELHGLNLYIHHRIFEGSDFEHEMGLYTRILQELQPALTLEKILAEVVAIDGEIVDNGIDGGDGELKTSVSDPGRSGDQRKLQSFSVLTNKILAPAVKRNVLIRHGGGFADNSQLCNGSDQPFNIILWSSPLGDIHQPAPSRLFGLPVFHNDLVFDLSGQGVPLFDDDGFVVAELVEDALYVHYDLMRSGNLIEARTFARLLKAARALHESLAQEPPAIDAATQVDFVDVCLDASKNTAGTAGGSSKINPLQNAMHDLLLQTRQEEQALFQLEAAPDAELGEEFDRLLQVANVLDVKVTEHSINVTTDVLFCRNPLTRQLHEIGAFEIQIPTGSGEVRWLNKTRKVSAYQEGMHAPHVFPNGHACLGNVKDLFPQLIQKRDFASAVEVAIAFVESVNVDDRAGAHIGKWPLAQV